MKKELRNILLQQNSYTSCACVCETLNIDIRVAQLVLLELISEIVLILDESLIYARACAHLCCTWKSNTAAVKYTYLYLYGH